MTSPFVPLADRLWARVDKTPTCWLWTGSTAPAVNGYGHLAYQRKHLGAHRVSYELAYGPIPKGMFVLHRCDQPRCVRPDHLFLGTHLDNIQDATAKGRMHPGSRNGMAKLTEAAVLTIRAEFTGRRGEIAAFARRFGVTDGAVRQAIRGQTWQRAGERDA